VVIGVELVRPRLPRTRILRDLAVAGLAIAAVMAPIALVYVRLQRDMGFTRDIGQLGGLSARLTDYFRVAAGAWNWGGLLPDGGANGSCFTVSPFSCSRPPACASRRAIEQRSRLATDCGR
jgi:hypothetical protein